MTEHERQATGLRHPAEPRAYLDVPVLPWRVRKRKMHPDTLRDMVSPTGGEDLGGVLLGIAVWVLILVAAPLLVLVLAGVLLSVELLLLAVLAIVLAVSRVTGLVPWTVVLHDSATGARHEESFRSLLRARRRVRDANLDGAVPVRWTLSRRAAQP